MSQYLILIYDDEAAWAAADGQTAQRVLGEHQRFIAEHAPVIRGGNRLRASDTATSVRHEAGGGVSITDAPFAETKEAVGGYYLIDVADLDEALAVARQVPAPFGGVEVRPVWASGTEPGEPGAG